MNDAPYGDKVVPIGDKSMQYFEDALVADTGHSRRHIREILRKCWRDVRNAGLSSPQTED